MNWNKISHYTTDFRIILLIVVIGLVLAMISLNSIITRYYFVFICVYTLFMIVFNFIVGIVVEPEKPCS